MEQIIKKSIFKIDMMGKQADDVANFYKKIIKELTSKNVQVRVDEINEGCSVDLVSIRNGTVLTLRYE